VLEKFMTTIRGALQAMLNEAATPLIDSFALWKEKENA
jgi:hypothetical protein